MSSSSSSSSAPVPVDCRYGIELSREVSEYHVTGRPQAWRMRVWVSEAYNVDPNIFLYLRRGPADLDGTYRDTFEAICSPVDIEEYPVGTPAPDLEPFYRVADVDLVSRSKELLEDTWRLMLSDRDELVRTLQHICELHLSDVSRYGEFPELPSGSSSGSSESGGSSSSAWACPTDTIEALTVTDSQDAEFPPDTRLDDTGVTPEPGNDCIRQFEAAGVITPAVRLRVTVYPLAGVFVAERSTDSGSTYTTADTGGCGDGYRMLLQYDDMQVALVGASYSSLSSSSL